MRNETKETGSILFLSFVMTMMLIGMTMSMLVVVSSAKLEQQVSNDHVKRL